MRKVLCSIFLILFSFVFLLSTFIYAQSGIKLEVDGKILDTEVEPYIEKDTAMVPLAVVAENIGAEVTWYPEDKKIELTKQKDTVVFHIDKTTATLNGENIELASAPIIKDSITFVPAKLMADSFDASVKWDDKIRTVSITFDDTANASSSSNSNDFFKNRTYLLIVILGLILIVVVLILSFVYRKHNRPKCEFYNVRFIPFKRNKAGEFERVCLTKKAVLCEYSFNVEIISPNNEKSNISSVLLIFKSFKSKAFSKPYQIRKLESKTEDNVIRLGIKGVVKGSRIKILRKNFKLYFEGLYENGSKFRVKMLDKYKINISESELYN